MTQRYNTVLGQYGEIWQTDSGRSFLADDYKWASDVFDLLVEEQGAKSCDYSSYDHTAETIYFCLVFQDGSITYDRLSPKTIVGL